MTPLPSSEVSRRIQSSLPKPRQRVWLIMLSLALLTALAGQASAQQRDEDIRRALHEAAERLRAIEEERAIELRLLQAEKMAAQVEGRVPIQVLPDAQFEQWVFQQDRNAPSARQRLDSQLASQMERIDRVCKLTDPQKKKLQLAGRGDIKRFFDGFERVKQDFRSLNNDAQKLHEIEWEVNPLRASLQAGLFLNDSLLNKSLRSTLTAEQLESYDAMVRESRSFRHRAAVEMAVAILEQSMPVRDAQRRELIALMLSETKPSERSGQYDYHLMLFQLSRLPEEKVKPLFSETQWKVVKRQLDQFRGLEQHLRQVGQWPIELDLGGVPAPAR